MAQHVFDAQTLGSFLAQEAWSRGESPATMARRIGLEWSIWTRDIDRSVCESAIEIISKATQLTEEGVRSKTLIYSLDRAGVPTRRNGFQRWLTPVGIYHRRRLRFGQLYCPECIRSEQVQLFMSWRLGSNWLCPIHSLFLRDSCSQCGMPFVPYRNDALMTSRCDRCAASLFRGPTQTTSRSERELQMRIRALWDAAICGQNAALVAFYEALTLAATRNPIFSRSGEPWTFWRIDERRSLLVNVAEGCIDSCEGLTGASSMRIGRKVREPGSRHRFLPREPAARAGTLLKMAARVTFSRRPAARIDKSS